ncbi:MAG: hypothetical protein IPL52_10615 [Flavobacteriales bacterium]|nr:hypothetical protein [Flavobacteriales bacterium]
MQFENSLMYRMARAAMAVAVALLAAGAASAQLADHHDHGGIDELLNRHEQEIHFVENKGQLGPSVLYRADFPLGQAVATREDAHERLRPEGR